jgi:N-methylhydantoinase A/oxoprolinase/acetone carboxylase beta subunit
MRVSSDTGGTFTDLVTDTGEITKVPSTPDDPGEAVRAGIDELSVAVVDELTHGTTVATNALLERRGAPTGLVTTAGFADVIEIARQDRPSLYDSTIDRPTPLVPRAWRYEVDGRLDARANELVPLEVSSLPTVDTAIHAMAVCLLHADLDGRHERLIGAALERHGYDVTLSSEISPEFREYERTVTTTVNAYLRPVCRSYLHGLSTAASEVLVMTSAGGLVPASEAAERPAALLVSGPAGGVLAGAAVATANGWHDAVTFDMGGTSTDVCLVLDGRPEPAPEHVVAGFPVRMPSLDVHTIGAGGGSTASIDPGGALVVGPRSAGAVPGPACYGKGGELPTVTDANLVAERIPAGAPFPGIGTLDVEAARGALERAGVTAEGVLEVVNANMEQALRRVSVERGVDPRRLALVAFGGAGPLHACALADALDMPCVIVPPRAGVFSAVGILSAPRQVDLVRSWLTPLDHHGLEEALGGLAAESRRALGDDRRVEVEVSFDCRYEGQSHELRVRSTAAFHAEHERRNGYRRDSHPVEVIALRATARLNAPVGIDDLPVVQRATGTGPRVIPEPDCTIWVPEGWSAEMGEAGALVLRRT